MEKSKSFIFIIALVFILFFLILLQIIIADLNKKNQLSNLDFKNDQKQNLFSTKYSQKAQKIEKMKSPLPYPSSFFLSKPFEKNLTEKIDELKNKAPLTSDDFKIEYFYPADTFIVYEKTPQAKEEFLNFLKENHLEELKDTKIFIFTQDSKEKFQNKIENILIKSKESSFFNSISPTPLSSPSSLNSPLPTSFNSISPTPLNSPSSLNYPLPTSNLGENSLSILVDLLKIMLAPSSVNLPTNISPTILPINISPTEAAVTQPVEKPNLIPNSLSEIFEETSIKIGVPKKILEAVLRIETPSTFNLSPSEIQKYSTPGDFLPHCGPNICSATGPMQMTIGVDHNGNSSCPSCGIGFCPNAWAVYGNAINILGNYSHSPNPCNIRDNIYAATWKLKKDSGAADPLIWTKDQVFRAATRYYGSCSNKYRFSRLGGRTYCEYVWDYYQGNI